MFSGVTFSVAGWLNLCLVYVWVLLQGSIPTKLDFILFGYGVLLVVLGEIRKINEQLQENQQ